MRIVQLADYGGPYPGSFLPALQAIERQAAARGAGAEMVFGPAAGERPWYQQLVTEGRQVCTAPTLERRALAGWLEQRLAGDRRATVLHTHFTSFDLPATAVARRLPQVDVVWHFHSRFEPGAYAFARNTAKLGIAGRQTAAILCVSRDLRAAALRRLAPPGRTIAFPNAIDLRHHRPVEDAERRAARSELGLAPNRSLLVHFGWDWQTKGGDLFLEAVAELVKRGLDFTAISVGGGAPAGASAARLGLAERVQAVEPRDDVRTFYAAADVFVASSEAEGAMPFAALEALASGTPVVASAIPNHVRLARRTRGCVVAEREPRALAGAILGVLRERQQGRLVVDLGSLASELDLDAWAERVLDIYASHTKDSGC